MTNYNNRKTPMILFSFKLILDVHTLALPPPEQPFVRKVIKCLFLIYTNTILFLQPWHAHVTHDLRNHLVEKLAKALFPLRHPAAIHDPCLLELVTYARKAERKMFEAANDREEYYHLLAEKIYKIQKELQEKKLERTGRREGKIKCFDLLVNARFYSHYNGN
jgi:hypothetical protein